MKLVLGWLLVAGIAAAASALIWPAAHLGGEYLPVGNDSFYHARRILDGANNLSEFYQFDPKIHAPEGSLLTWPWGYDYALSRLVKFGLLAGITDDPMRILIWIPVAAVFLSVGLIFLIARQLSLSIWATSLAGLCVALSPLTQFLHGVGIIDHHFAEYIFVLATLSAGISYFAQSQSVTRAVICGAVLGVAPAVHNGLFILQAPLLITLFFLWLRNIKLPAKTAAYLCLTLILTTLAAVIPSLPFRLWRFEFYTLSWFHLYAAVSSCVLMLAMRQLRPTFGGSVVLALITLTLVLPAAHQVAGGHDFLAGNIARLDVISEMRSLPELISRPGGFLQVSSYYSLLVWLLPLTFIICGYKLLQESKAERAFFWIYAILGLGLLFTQFRLHYFGSFALYLPWLLLADEFATRHLERFKLAMLGTSLALLLCYSPSLRYQFSAQAAPANDPAFSELRPLLGVLADVCKADPGIVLSDSDAGHYIRYYTDCAVIANNFLLTPQHEDKIAEIDRLMGLSAEDFPHDHNQVKYILLRPVKIEHRTQNQYHYVAFNPAVTSLLTDLLLQPASKIDDRHYSLIGEIHLPRLEGIPYARLYRVIRGSN